MRTPFAAALLAAPITAGAFEVSKDFEITAALRGLFQYGSYANAVDDAGRPLNNRAKAAGILDLEVSLQPSDRDAIYGWARFAAGNALNNVGGIALDAYGDPLQSELVDINGTGRNYLMEAWYRHSFALAAGRSVALTGGIIDSGEFIGENEFADEEDTQFMNEGFSFSGTDIFPAYDPGGGFTLDLGQWSVSGVAMGAHNQEGSFYDYYAGQAAYSPQTALGEGNYRLFSFTTNRAFDNLDGTGGSARLTGWGFSFDQELGQSLGGFVRGFYANDRVLTDYNQQLAAGLNIRGSIWGREQDTIGIGYAQLRGPRGAETSRADVAEAYVRFELTRRLDLSLDLQYQKDRPRQAEGMPDGGLTELDNPSAWITSIRVNLVF